MHFESHWNWRVYHLLLRSSYLYLTLSPIDLVDSGSTLEADGEDACSFLDRSPLSLLGIVAEKGPQKEKDHPCSIQTQY
jgi:hypothetical protein